MRRSILAALLLASCSKPSDPLPGAATAGLEKIQVISRGKAYAVGDHVHPGHLTILYFYATW